MKISNSMGWTTQPHMHMWKVSINKKMEYLTNGFCVGLISIACIIWPIYEVTNGSNNQESEPEEALPKTIEEYLLNQKHTGRFCHRYLV